MDYSPAGSPIPPRVRWDGSYEALVAEILSGFVKSFDPESELPGSLRQTRVSSAPYFWFTHPRKSPNFACCTSNRRRGHGIGRTLVDECIAFARAKHYEH